MCGFKEPPVSSFTPNEFAAKKNEAIKKQTIIQKRIKDLIFSLLSIIYLSYLELFLIFNIIQNIVAIIEIKTKYPIEVPNKL